MPQLDLDGANSKISADTIRGQSGTTVTVQSGHNLVGSGSGLTALPAGNLTGTVADARISALTASKLTGALPAISGALLTSLPSAGIVDSIVTASYDLSTSAGTQSITGAGFTPSSAIMLYCKVGTNTVGVGFAVGSTEYTICNEHHTSAETWSTFSKIAMCVTGSATHASCTVSMTSDGIDLAWVLSGSPSGTLIQRFLFFK